MTADSELTDDQVRRLHIEHKQRVALHEAGHVVLASEWGFTGVARLETTGKCPEAEMSWTGAFNPSVCVALGDHQRHCYQLSGLVAELIWDNEVRVNAVIASMVHPKDERQSAAMIAGVVADVVLEAWREDGTNPSASDMDGIPEDWARRRDIIFSILLVLYERWNQVAMIAEELMNSEVFDSGSNADRARVGLTQISSQDELGARPTA